METAINRMSLYPKLSFLLVLLVFGCTTSGEKTGSALDQPWVGKWKAEWKTEPEAFPDVSGIEKFSMNGNLTFDSDGSVEIAAFGFPGCIFSSDTLEHELTWQVKNDTLNLRSVDDPYGIPYNIIELSGKKVELRLMGDITLTLTR